jgi:hypothetical protein
MKRVVLVFLLVLILVAFFPQEGKAGSVEPSIRFYPCIRADGRYTLKVEVVGGVSDPASLDDALNGVGYNLWFRKNGGEWTYYGYVLPGWIGPFWDIPEGTTYEFSFYGGMTVVQPPELTLATYVPPSYRITLQGTDYPRCETCTGKPIFKMYLLTQADSYCLIISDLHPSVERQKAICFPGTDWVATSTPCVGWVCNNDCWDCDVFGYERLSLKNLRPIYERHLNR